VFRRLARERLEIRSTLSCFGQKTLSAACKTAFEQADVAFAAALASTLTELQNRQ
jgi:hypothetical protein